MRKGIALWVVMMSIAGSGAIAQDATGSTEDQLSGQPFRFPQVAMLKATEGAPYTLIVDEPLAYGWTGHVSADVHNKALFGAAKFKTPALVEGQGVYGIPMGYGGGGGALFWCAPQKKKSGWWATCMRPGEKVTYSAFQGGLIVQGFSANTAQGSEPISVRVEAAPELIRGLRIKHYVGKWHKKYLELSTLAFVDQEQDGNGFWVNVPRAPDGSVHIALGGGELKFVERADGGFTVSMEKPFAAEGSAMIAAAHPPSVERP